ncbi:RNA polymerase II subunit [Glomus cerebriforme]|uniref:DNA-directed RNA polymerases I, II, and III subunit RPABC5 n=1 Tax=Glomus cerebriforme TaxID=658196 RepID=A0A397S423_9GLOM|nr:RNA polymerase II subunit [Glomus cerebriforme]
MIIPICCFTCEKVLANKWNHYQTMLENEYSESAALEALGITRYCHHRMLISHVDFIHKILSIACKLNQFGVRSVYM